MRKRTLGRRYRLIEDIGSGGMGTVYRARDNRTGTTVAVKVLHPHLTRDAEYLERFRREIEITRSLTSPNIIRVLDFGEDGAERFLVMEYVEGVSLHRLLRQSGALPLQQALDIATQIAAALTEAHAKGVVHRDIKPENIIITPDGRAKVGDFGIARAQDHTRLTLTGAVVGTVQYMAPELLTGGGDARADIYSLGVILYQMLVGAPPFEAPTPWEILRKHREEPVPPLPAPSEFPAEIVRLVELCLSKDPAERPQTAMELVVRLELLHDSVLSEPDSLQAPKITQAQSPQRGLLRRPPWRLSAGLISSIAIASGAIGFWHYSMAARGAASNPSVVVAGSPDPGTHSAVGAVSSAADDKFDRIAYVGLDDNIWTMDPSGAATTQLTSDGGNSSPRWSPGGTRIAFVHTIGPDFPATERQLTTMRPDGTERKVITVDFPAISGPPAAVNNVRWSADGCSLYVHVGRAVGTHPIRSVPLCGGVDQDWSFTHFFDVRADNTVVRSMYANGPGTYSLLIGRLGDDSHQLLIPEADEGPVAWSPDGKTIAYLSAGSGVVLMLSEAGTAINSVRLGSMSKPSSIGWSPNGEQLLAGNGTDIALITTSGTQTGVTIGKGKEADWGRTATRPPSNGTPEAAIVTPATIGNSIGRIVFVSGRDGTPQIYVMNSDGTGQTRLTSDPASAPAWSPDGTQIAFVSGDAASSGIYIMNGDGGALKHLAGTDGGTSPSWSPDGKEIAFATFSAGDIFVTAVDAGAAGARQLTHTPAEDESEPAWSPDGARIAYISLRNVDGKDVTELSVMNADGSNVRRLTQASPGYGHGHPRWSPDGTRIAFVSDPIGSFSYRINIIDQDGKNLVTLPQTGLSDEDPSWSPDGHQIAFAAELIGRRHDIFVMNLDGSGAINLTNNGNYHGQPGWRPEGASQGETKPSGSRLTPVSGCDSSDGQIAYTGDVETTAPFLDIFVINADGTGRKRLTNNSNTQYGNFAPAWSPDGRRMTFTRGTFTSPGIGYQIYVMNSDGSGQQQLTHAAYTGSSSWAPDGTRIAFESLTGYPVGTGEIYVIGADGSGVTRLTGGPDDKSASGHPSWSPDGKRIAFRFSSASQPSEIRIMDADGSHSTRLVNGSDPAWSPDGRQIAFARDKGIYVIDADGKNETEVLTLGTSAESPTWSPDGKRIAFLSNQGQRFDNYFQLYVVNTDGSALLQLTTELRGALTPAWSPCA